MFRPKTAGELHGGVGPHQDKGVMERRGLGIHTLSLISALPAGGRGNQGERLPIRAVGLPKHRTDRWTRVEGQSGGETGDIHPLKEHVPEV